MIEAGAIVVFVGLLWLLEWRHGRERVALYRHFHDERAAWDATRATTPDLEALIALVDRLCQRIQAPQVAVAQHVEATAGDAYAPQPIWGDDDDALLLDKEQLAEQQWREELEARGVA